MPSSDHPVVVPTSSSPVRTRAMSLTPVVVVVVALVLVAAACGGGSGDDVLGSGSGSGEGSSTSAGGTADDEGGTATTNPASTTTDPDADGTDGTDGDEGAGDGEVGSTGDPTSGAGGDGGDGGASADGRPETFWAIEAGTFDLIEVDVEGGDEVGRISGWGAPPGGDPSLVLQALQRVDVSPDGWLWLDDCCEPAFGNVFGLDPNRVTALDQVFGSVDGPDGRQLVGLSPSTSPDGSLLAWGNGPFEVTVADSRGDAVGSVLAGDEETFAYPLAWLDDTTLAAAVAGRGETTITFWDLRTPSSPVPVGSPQVVAGLVADAARTGDGSILVVFGPEPVTNPSRSGAMVTPTGTAPIEVPDGLISVDRDPSGRHLLWVGADGLVRTGPLGDDAPVLSGIEVLWASW